MSGGPEQRAMPGSLKPAFTHWDSQRRSQLQYRGLAPRALWRNSRQTLFKTIVRCGFGGGFVLGLIDADILDRRRGTI